MASVQQHTLDTLSATAGALSEHISASSKRIEAVSATRETRIAQLSVLQQELHLVFESLRRMQRRCDNAKTHQAPLAPTSTSDIIA